MTASIQIKESTYIIDLDKPLDISIRLNTMNGPNAFHAPPYKTEPVRAGNFVGSVAEGGPVNFKNLFLNPHGNGTHTESVAHISDLLIDVSDVIKHSFYTCQLITVTPSQEGDDRIIQIKDLPELAPGIDALAIRTLPNPGEKKGLIYSGANPAYMHHDVANAIREHGVKHLLIDLPSVDREEDSGHLLAHKAFWDFLGQARTDASISELIYVADETQDGHYLLEIQLLNIALDVSPSRPRLYSLLK